MRGADVRYVGVKYLRASKDRFGNSISVESQEDEGNEFFEDHGIEDAGTFTDNHLSASVYATEGRPDYERALDMLRQGKANLLWTFESGRAQRDIEIYAKLRRILKEMGAFWAYGGRIYDMTNARDRRDTLRDAVDAEGVSDAISDHVRRGVRKRARSGKHAGSRAFGYRSVYDPDTGESLGWVIEENEARVVRRIRDAGLEGKPLARIALDLNADGVPCARDRKWDARLVRKVLNEYRHEREWNGLLAKLDPAEQDVARTVAARGQAGDTPRAIARDLNREKVPYLFPSKWDETKVKNIMLSRPAAGLRQHHGDVLMTKVVDESGAEVMVPSKVQWKEIISPDDHAILSARYNDPNRYRNKDGTRVKWWWSGIALCGECESPMTRSARQGGRYLCRAGRCVSRDQDLLDAWLTEQALLMLERTDAAKLFRLDADLSESQSALQEAKQLRAELDGWRQDAIAGRVTRASFIEIEAGLTRRIEQAEERAQRATLPPLLTDIIGPGARQAFLGLDIAAQREILRTIMRPRIYKTPRRLVNRLDTDTIDPGFLIASEDGGLDVAVA
ncbi:recombinase family protein [Allokutzneria sp. A3M-2-11 16]|uniref:recombinase family protein n=1 Tax=Allokutzneria sp. A3M-2-11 16 TaxID=2962043 RepID=UPI0020B6388B|nr:recombinase family protein [Allokutzneria sp. A3M-2-11 16]MCP3800307.1 recombinase family protein [Allokutzneria sp. A3M-2-11 16]